MGVLTLPFFEAIAVGCLSGLVGTLMVLGNRVFFAESLSHGTFPGAVLGVVVANALGANLSDGLMLGSVAVCIPLAIFMHYLGKVHGVSSTAAAGTTLTLGFAMGILLLRWFQPLPLHVDSFLVGSLTTVNHRDVAVAAGLVIIFFLAGFGLPRPPSPGRAAPATRLVCRCVPSCAPSTSSITPRMPYLSWPIPLRLLPWRRTCPAMPMPSL